MTFKKTLSYSYLHDDVTLKLKAVCVCVGGSLGGPQPNASCVPDGVVPRVVFPGCSFAFS